MANSASGIRRKSRLDPEEDVENQPSASVSLLNYPDHINIIFQSPLAKQPHLPFKSKVRIGSQWMETNL